MLSLVLPTRDVIQATPRTRSLTLDLGATSFPFTAGQAVLVGLAHGTVRRPYSIACSPTRGRKINALELLVQIDDHEAPDPHLERAIPGTRLRVEGPFGSFGLPSPIPERRMLLIAGGTGIAPLRSMMWETLEQQPAVDQALIYSARSPEEFAYLEELNHLAAQGRIELQLTITRDSRNTWTGGRGRIAPELVRSMLKAEETRCVICGPPTMVAAARTFLQEAGVPNQRIIWEEFAG